MNIGLIDVDGHKFPNLALMKISAYHKGKGDTVEWYSAFEHYDIVYMSKVFKFKPDYRFTIANADRVERGGTGYDLHKHLPEEIDRLQPDYSIYPHIDSRTAYGFLTRGCPNRCPWCVVPRKEGRIRPYMDVEEIAVEGRDKLVLMDNNILAAGEYAVEQLEKIIRNGYQVDFNQALDARLVDDRFARLLAQVHWINRRIRFGCDTKGQIEECERAIRMINGYGYKGEYFLYTMIGGKSDFKESYERVHYWWRRNHEQRLEHLPNIYPYAQPYRDPDNAQNTPMWQRDMAQWVNKHQIFQLTDFKDFEPRKGFKCVEYLRMYIGE